MTHKLIKTGNYLLIVDDSEIKEGDRYYLESISTKNMILKASEHITSSNCKKIIAHLPLNNSSILQGVDLLPLLEQEDDVDKLAEEYGENIGNKNGTAAFDYKRGYNKAKEKYKWTNEDVVRIVEKSRETGLTAEYLIQSLSQPKMPVGFEHIYTTINSQGQTQWVGKYIY
jgi:hypothetical protein